MNKTNLKDVLKLLNVLYIVKNENKCKKTINTLNIFFHDTLISKNIKDGLEIFLKSRPAVIITDIDLPDKSGIDFIKEIRKTNKHIPIIILSALKDEKYLFEAIKLNLIEYLLYPVDVSKLINALNNTAKAIVYHGQTEVKLKNNSKYNYMTKTVIDFNNNVHTLTKNEFRLIEYLIENRNRKVPKHEIEAHLWAHECVTDSAFKSLFNRLCHKIGKESIVNTFGIGYGIEIH